MKHNERRKNLTNHRNNQTQRLEQVNELALVRRLSSAEQRRFLDCNELLLVRKRLELSAGVGLSGKVFVLTENANLAANGLGSVLVVSARSSKEAGVSRGRRSTVSAQK
jgi:hypothetical protein